MITINKNKLLALLKYKGITTEALAEKLGISVSSTYNKLNDRSKFTEDEIIRLADVLNVKAGYLFTDDL